MDTNAYIESGILERYAMGDTDETESRTVEENAGRYPEVQAELAAIRSSLAAYAAVFSKAPPARLKDDIWRRISATNAAAAGHTASGGESGTAYKEVPRVVRMDTYATWLVAATVALLLSLAVNLYQYNRLNETKSRLAALQSAQTEMARAFDVKRASLDQAQQQLALLTNPAVQPVPLKGTPDHPEALATVYWDKSTSAVYLFVNHLPAPPAGRQYQLWAIVNGQPVDAGVFDASATAATLLEMKNFPEAQAFAVTVERLGGSLVPTLETMVVVGST